MSQGLYIIQDTEKITEEQLTELVMAAENAPPRKGITICFVLPPDTKRTHKDEEYNIAHFQEERKKKKPAMKVETIVGPERLIEIPELNDRFLKKEKLYLPALVSYLFLRHGLPETPLLVAGFISCFSDTPLSMLSEIKKLSVLYSDPRFSAPETLLKILKKTEKKDIWRFLDGLGLRNIKRALADLCTINFRQKEETEQVFAQIKTHFRKIFFLKSLITETEKRQLMINTDSFFRARNNWQKKGLMEENRQILLEKNLSERQKSLFNRYFKNDYYLAKMLWQQNRFSTAELLKLMIEISETGIKIRYSGQPPENTIFGFISSFCA